MIIAASPQALEDMRRGRTGEVPVHLRDAHRPGAEALGHGQGYPYPHAFEREVVTQQYLPDQASGMPYYAPTATGFEQTINLRLSLGRRLHAPEHDRIRHRKGSSMNSSRLMQMAAKFPAEHQVAARHHDPIGQEISRVAQDIEELLQEYGHSGALQDSVLHAIGRGLERLRLHGTIQALSRDLAERVAEIDRLSDSLAGDHGAGALDRIGSEVRRQTEEVADIVRNVAA
ncbi:hypothetical protein [Streptomyces sp. NPDC093149]|uniref:AAA family ATPase n=1 Tax=Streptomyces sp. NPDC093149 TaxID=3366031 RepID=UPI003825A2FE